jgi:hypothetical protein
MAPQTYKQMRCSHGYAGHCKRAGGYHFLVADWLPWTLIGMCRPCAEEVRKDLIYQAAQAVGLRGVQTLQGRGAVDAPREFRHSRALGAGDQLGLAGMRPDLDAITQW